MAIKSIIQLYTDGTISNIISIVNGWIIGRTLSALVFGFRPRR